MAMMAPSKRPPVSEQVPALVTIADAQEALNCSRENIYRLVKAEKLEMVRVGKRGLRVTERSVVRLINDQLKEQRA